MTLMHRFNKAADLLDQVLQVGFSSKQCWWGTTDGRKIVWMCFRDSTRLHCPDATRVE